MKITNKLVEQIKSDVLGEKYELSLVYASNALSRKLNRTYRGKDKPTNVLSFPLSETSGEIFINSTIAKKEAKLFGQSEKNFMIYLFIHGILHLNGFEHGRKMEHEEKSLLRKYGATNRSRN